MRSTPVLRHRLRRRARRTLVLALGLLALANVAGWGALQARARLRDPMYYQRADLLESRTRAPDHPFVVVALGSSRVQRGFAPSAVHLEPRLSQALGRPAVVFNFGVQGSGPLLHELYLHRMLRDGPRPDALYLEVVPSMLFDASGEPRERASRSLDARFLRWDELDVLERRGAGWPEMRAEWYKVRAKALWEYRFQFVWGALPVWVPPQYSAPRGAPADASGWTPIVLDSFPEAMRREALAGARRDHGRAVSEGTLHPAPVAALRAICETCRHEQIPLTLVLMPEGPSFRALYAPEVEARVAALLDQLTREFGVPLVNARLWVDEPDFTDGHHLLPTGAKRFTARFADEVLLPDAARWHVAP
ncbi:MAG TPA: hypothetical protein VGE74_00795 [Gemmata sp.]